MADLLQVVYEPMSGFSWAASSSDSSTRESSSTADASDPVSETSLTLRTRRRPFPRMGHTKSRNGCYHCKRRKVKCQETRPACAHCSRIGLKCTYPPANTRPPTDSSYHSSSPSPAFPHITPLSPISATPTFTPDDLRFLSHFLLKSYPPLPIHGEAIWRDVACLSHSFPFLLHSVLGLAASSLSLSPLPSAGSASRYSAPALSHRVKALRLLNRSLSTPCKTAEEGTARYAAMMALTFQSSYMPDGMVEFVTMSRGCHVVATTAMGGGGFEESPFGVFKREAHVDACRRLGPRVKGGGERLTEQVVEVMSDALSELRAGCGSMGNLETELLGRLERIVALGRWDCLEAFDEVTLVYALLGEADHDEFRAFLNAENWPAQILLVYFFLLEYLVAYHAMGFIRQSFEYRTATTKLWVKNLAAKIPDEYARYLQPPVKIVESLG